MLCLLDAWFGYEDYVLRGATLCVKRGVLGVVVGPMGSGKSTLLYALASLLPLKRGSVVLDGRSFSQADRRRVGVLFQNPDDQLFNATVYDEIAYSVRTAGVDEEEVRRRVLEVSEELGIREFLDRNPFKLSYGQKKLVALASVAVYDPEFLLLDEPTANLDKGSYETLVAFVSKALESGKGVLVASHEPDWASVADEVYTMRDGKPVMVEALEALGELPLPPSWLTLLDILGEKALDVVRERSPLRRRKIL